MATPASCALSTDASQPRVISRVMGRNPRSGSSVVVRRQSAAEPTLSGQRVAAPDKGHQRWPAQGIESKKRQEHATFRHVLCSTGGVMRCLVCGVLDSYVVQWADP